MLTDRRLQVLAVWHLVALSASFVVDRALFLPLAIWTVVAVGVWYWQPAPHLPVAFCLAMAEEALVYAFGGGLHGAAVSLRHDYVVALPPFAALVLGWHLVARRYRVERATVLLLAGLHGVVLELVVGGLGVTPETVFLFGAPVVVIYGSIVAGPRLPAGQRPFSPRSAVGAWAGVFGGLVVSGIVADRLAVLLL